MAACLCPIVDGLIDTGDGIVLSVCVEYREILHHGNDVRLLCGSDLVTCFRFGSICLSRGCFSSPLPLSAAAWTCPATVACAHGVGCGQASCWLAVHSSLVLHCPIQSPYTLLQAKLGVTPMPTPAWKVSCFGVSSRRAVLFSLPNLISSQR